MIDTLALVLVLGASSLLYAFSAFEKIGDREAFRITLDAYQILPSAMGRVTVQLVISLELVAATLLITPGFIYGLWLAIGLQVAYATAIGINLVRGRTYIDCGCLGSEGEGISAWHLLRNLVLLTLMSAALLPSNAREFVWLDYMLVPLGLAALALVYVTTAMLLSNNTRQQPWRI